MTASRVRRRPGAGDDNGRFMSRLLRCAPLAIAITVAGCGLLKGNEETQKIVAQAAVGLQAGEFFSRYGAAYRRVELPDGTAAYDWASRLQTTAAGVNGLDDRVCKLHVVVDSRGRVATATVVFDAPGRISSSRCSEVFKGKQDAIGATPRT